MNTTAKTVPKKKARFNISHIAGLLVVTTLTGQLLGLLRTKLVNANFPVSGPQGTDAYFAAFTIPDFFFFTLAAGALGVAFMPVLSDRLYKGDKKGVWELSSSLMNLLAILMTIVAVVILVFAKPLIEHVVAPGLSAEETNNAATIMRLLAFNPLLFTITGIFTSVQQTMGRFFFYAIAPLFYNLSIIASIFIFKDSLGLVGLGVGALIGGILQVVVVIIGNYKLNFHWRPKINFKSKDFRTVLRNLPPRSIDQGIDQISNIIETRIASGLGSGSITYWNNAFILSTAPILLIGTAISTAAFPRLNERLSQGRKDLFRSDFLMVMSAMIWITAPVVIVGFFARGYLARLIYTNGNQEISIIFGFLTMAIFFRVIYSLVSRWFYSQKDTRTPLYVSLFTIALNIALAYTLAKSTAYGVAGLAIAQSIVAAVEVFILAVIMIIRDPKLFDLKFINGLFKIMAVSGFTVVAAFIMISLYPLQINDTGFLTLGSKLLLIAGVSFAVHIGVSALFGLDEVKPIFRRARRIILKPIRIDPRSK